MFENISLSNNSLHIWLLPSTVLIMAINLLYFNVLFFYLATSYWNCRFYLIPIRLIKVPSSIHLSLHLNVIFFQLKINTELVILKVKSKIVLLSSFTLIWFQWIKWSLNLEVVSFLLLIIICCKYSLVFFPCRIYHLAAYLEQYSNTSWISKYKYSTSMIYNELYMRLN